MRTDFAEYIPYKAELDKFTGYITTPELKYFENGKCKCTFGIPLKKDEEVIWLNCECWGRIAEKCAELKKGDEVLVFGYFKEDEYKNKEGKHVKKKIFVVKGVI